MSTPRPSGDWKLLSDECPTLRGDDLAHQIRALASWLSRGRSEGEFFASKYISLADARLIRDGVRRHGVRQ